MESELFFYSTFANKSRVILILINFAPWLRWDERGAVRLNMEILEDHGFILKIVRIRVISGCFLRPEGERTLLLRHGNSHGPLRKNGCSISWKNDNFLFILHFWGLALTKMFCKTKIWFQPQDISVTSSLSFNVLPILAKTQRRNKPESVEFTHLVYAQNGSL